MLGKIVHYDATSESGILEGNDTVSYPFSLMDCVGFAQDPRKGDPVEFGLEGGVPYYVRFQKNPSREVSQEYETAFASEKPQPRVEDISGAIAVEYSVDESIFHYFSSMIVDLEEYEYDFEEYERLDYIRMRRFLTTAYHNLLDLDPKFVNNELIAFYEYVGDIYRLYKTFVKKITLPKIAYEEIFLAAQSGYVWRKARLESNRREIATQKGTIKNLAGEIERMKQKILKSPKEAAVALDAEFKRYNRMYVDALHHAATLRDENILLLREVKAFEEAHYGEFVSRFSQFARERKEQILRLLDGYSYYFDKKMWDCAESSKSIREFFRKANVQEEFSSKTYLKYYLKGLDEFKMSELHRELKTLLAYLESLSQVSVAVVDEDKEAKFRLLKVLRLNNTDVRASSYERVKLFAQRLKKEPFDLALIDTKITNPSVEKALELLEQTQEKRTKKCRICLMATSFSKEELARYSALGVTNFLLKTLPEVELGRRLEELLEGLHVDQLRA